MLLTAPDTCATAHRILTEDAEVWRVRLAVDFAAGLRLAGLPDRAIESQLAQMLMVAMGVPSTTKLETFLFAAQAIIDLFEERGTDLAATSSIAHDECILRFMREARGF